MKRPTLFLLLALALLYSAYLFWYFQIEPRRGSQHIIWRLQCTGWPTVNPAIGPGGEVCLLASDALRVTGADGIERWSSLGPPAAGAANLTPFAPSAFALAADSAVYLLEYNLGTSNAASGAAGRLRRLDQQGQEQWSVPLAQGLAATQASLWAFSGGVELVSAGGQIEVFDAQGHPTASFKPTGFASSPPGLVFANQNLAFSPLGEISLALPNYGVQTYDAGGRLKWEYLDPAKSLQSALVRAADGTVFCANGSDVLAFDPEGKQRWKTVHASSNFSPGALACTSDGRLLAEEQSGAVLLFDAQGAPKRVTNGAAGLAMLCGGTRDSVIICDSRTGLRCCSLDGRERWQIRELTGLTQPPFYGPDGRLYVLQSNFLYCIQP